MTTTTGTAFVFCPDCRTLWLGVRAAKLSHPYGQATGKLVREGDATGLAYTPPQIKTQDVEWAESVVSL